MISAYFHNGKPVIDKIITFIRNSAMEYRVELNKIALVGGWAKEVRKTKNNNISSNLVDIQTVINNSPKCGGDVDFVIFVKEINVGWEKIISEHLNSGIPKNRKDGYVDIVLSLPANIRFPGIEVLNKNT